MMSTSQYPPAASITKESFAKILNLYPSLIRRVYASKLKNNEAKVKEAADRDDWRYEELPKVLRERKKGHLTKDEIERLVVWKM
jgi:hypothetical protein